MRYRFGELFRRIGGTRRPLCLSSVAKTTYPNHEMYLIDNASSDGSVEFVRKSYSSVKIIRNSSNLGFAGAYNKAINKIDA